MKPEQLYQHLKELAEKFDITVSEANFRKVGIHVRSGFCTVKGKKRFIIDKHAKLHEKIDILASFLSTLPHETCYVIPAVREVLDKFTGSDSARGKDDTTEEASQAD
jgi:hypothetical protein